ncbi:MAG TPA: hypothetical protein VGD65_17775 [Chryseosolibacter sp.]
MKTVKIVLIFVFSACAFKSNSKCHVVNDLSPDYPTPYVELKYLGEFFTRELIKSKSFRNNQLVPIQIELKKPPMKDHQADDLYLTIENVQVIFVVEESVPRTLDNFKGHLVMIPLRWAHSFTLEKGSRIIFKIKYNYNFKDNVVETGEITEEIRF